MPISKLRHPLIVFLHDLIMVSLAWLGAYWLRFNLRVVPDYYYIYALDLLPMLMALQAMILWRFGMYRGIWRFASLPDLVRILFAVTTGTAVWFGLLFLFARLEGIPRSILILYPLLLVIMLGGPRFLYRWLKDHQFRLSVGQRVLIVGAGQAGEMLVRDLLRSPNRAYSPIAFVDDDPASWGKELHSVRVLSGCESIPDVVQKHEIDIILLAIPSAVSKQMQRVVELCEKSGVPFQTIPPLEDLMSGQVNVNQLREVAIEDLLGREPVSLDWSGISAGLKGKTILVTGAGGSIGSELCRQIARLEPKALVLFDNSEFNLFRIENELRSLFPQGTFNVHLGDVCDLSAVRYVFNQYTPDTVFHAAAYKHVPMLQYQIRQAVWNNVLGTRTVATVAIENGCDAFVMISTDKAVNPTNVMGASKRVAEIYCQIKSRQSSTRFITVRFGNVLDSAGSVVPIFREQIGVGGPVTVTHPEIKRYFMTIPEASQLIMQAAVLGKGGEIFVLDMGEPVRITYLAEQMIRLSGKMPGEDVEIVYTGLRPGEKLYEELFHEEEQLRPTSHEKILLARYREMETTVLEQAIAELETVCDDFNEKRLEELLSILVPEFSNQNAHKNNVI